MAVHALSHPSSRRDGGFPIPAALCLSLLIHGLVFVMIGPILAAKGEVRPLEGRFASEELAPGEKPEDELTLGIDADTPSSMVWIGHDDYLEHLARLGEVDQAAFEEEPSGGSEGDSQAPVEGPSQPASPPAPAVEPTDAGAAEPLARDPAVEDPVEERRDEQPADATPPQTDAPTTTPDEPISREEERASEPTEAPPGAPPEGSPPIALPPPEFTEALSAFLPARRILERDAPAPQAEARDEGAPPSDAVAQPTPADEPRRIAPPTPPRAAAPTPPRSTPGDRPTPEVASREPAEASPGGAPGPRARQQADAERSDRESDATSTVEVPADVWRAGRPLATRGLEIRTRRPVFPELTRITARPRSPIVEIHFGPDGVPRRAGIVSTSGDSRVDGPLVDALYRWRASGPPLRALKEGETVRIELKIILSSE